MYLVGGSTAVEQGWRESTIDVDLRLEPEGEGVLRALPRIKIEQGVNVELASPLDFLPELPGWRDRSPLVALAKLERGFTQDLADVEAMVDRGLVQPSRSMELMTALEPDLYRLPAVDSGSLREAVQEVIDRRG